MAINIKEMTAKICESCGQSFGCGVDLDSCWCAAVELPSDTASGLKTKFQDCLCPKCLAAVVATPMKEKGPPLIS